MNFKALIALITLSLCATGHAQETPVPASGITVNVLGAVNKPSRFTLAGNGTVLDALASAGGATKIGDLSKVKLIHRSKGDKPDVTIVNVKQIMNGAAKDTVLRDGDTLFVPESVF